MTSTHAPVGVPVQKRDSHSVTMSSSMGTHVRQGTLITTGTPLGQWPELAKALLGGAEQSLSQACFSQWLTGLLGEPGPRSLLPDAASAPVSVAAPALAWQPSPGGWRGGLDHRACWALSVIERVASEPTYLVFVESPLSAVLAWLDGGHDRTAEEAIAFWENGARRLLQHIERHPDRCIVVSAEEAAANADASFAMLSEALSLSVQPGALPAIPDHDLVAAELALSALKDAPMVARLYEELHACCRQLQHGKPDLLGILTLGLQGVEAALRDLRSSRSRFEQLAEEVVALRLENSKQLGEADEGRARAQAECAEAKKESELLLLQLHQVQEELEHYWIEYRKLLDRPGLHRPAQDGFSVRRVEVLGVRETAPHCEVAALLTDVRIGGRYLPTLHARLVEHHGRPGLAIFAADEGSDVPLAAWTESGQEAGRRYHLFVPSEPSRVALWRSSPATDWRFLSALPHLIAAELKQEGERLRWQAVAQALEYQMIELPPRLRYDDLTFECMADDRHAITFSNVVFGARHLQHLRVRWCAASAAVELLADTGESGVRPLTSWPATAGASTDAWPVPGGQSGRRERVRRWHQISACDREFVLAVLDALPGAPARLREADPDRARLRGRAAEPLKHALRTLRGGRIRRVLARIGRRLVAADANPLGM